MKQIQTLLACTAISLLLVCCNDSATTDNTDGDSSGRVDTLNNSNAQAPSYVSTTPENVVLVRYKVSDFAKWRTQYDSRDSMRTANGLHNYVLGRGVEDTNTVLVAVKADDMEKAKAFSKDPALASAMRKGFMTGTPKYLFTKALYQDQSPNMSELRSLTTFTVKDWNVWQKSFEDGRQVRAENGLSDRAYGHDVDDNHKVVIVLAINDTAKANAYWKSDALKQRRAQGGVTGEVERFVYRVVQRY